MKWIQEFVDDASHLPEIWQEVEIWHDRHFTSYDLEVGELLSQGSKSLRKTQPAGQLDVSSLVGSLQLMAGLLSSSNQHMPVLRSRSPSGKLSPSSRMRLHSACSQMHKTPLLPWEMCQFFFWMWHFLCNAWLQCSAHSRLRFRAKSSSRASMLSVEKLGEIDEVHEFLVSVMVAMGKPTSAELELSLQFSRKRYPTNREMENHGLKSSLNFGICEFPGGFFSVRFLQFSQLSQPVSLHRIESSSGFVASSMPLRWEHGGTRGERIN